MIPTPQLEQEVHIYLNECEQNHRKPTYKGLASLLAVSPKTIGNVVHGLYNGHRYTDTPHATRCIDNSDFELIQGIYTEEG